HGAVARARARSLGELRHRVAPLLRQAAAAVDPLPLHDALPISVLGGSLGMGWNVHGQWFYDFQALPPASFETGSGPPSGTFSAMAGECISELTSTKQPAPGAAFVAGAL